MGGGDLGIDVLLVQEPNDWAKKLGRSGGFHHQTLGDVLLLASGALVDVGKAIGHIGPSRVADSLRLAEPSARLDYAPAAAHTWSQSTRR